MTSKFVDTGFVRFGASHVMGPSFAAGALGLKKASMRAFFAARPRTKLNQPAPLPAE